MDVRGQRVTVMGLGRHGGGVGAARFLSQQGARVTITDRATSVELAGSIAALSDCEIGCWRLGEHCEGDFRDADLVVANPAVRPDDPFLALARLSGVPVTSEIELFLERCRAPIAGVTGSNGKSSTTAMLAACLGAEGKRVWLGGNIGRSLLGDLPLIACNDAVVLELSSFQLQRLDSAPRGVDLAIVTNCAPNHLDWHGSYDEYCRAKHRLLLGQSVPSVAVLNAEDPETARWESLVQGALLEPWSDADVPQLRIAGNHQRMNARLAAAGAAAWGVSRAAIGRALAEFAGLPHRLQHIATLARREFYNDSLATTPESTCGALESFESRVWLLAGGSDKGNDFAQLGQAIATRAAGVACYGAVGEQLRLAAEQAHAKEVTRVATMRQALAWCWERSRPGDVILLSPACASYDQFRDYADRAAQFAAAVAELALDAAPAARINPCLP